ncbi:hypothetical protein [Fodinibius sediminis]|uniref:Uncharacterized protein n=1 Tax=Fodinibius sediminis TaxID=1214077 RepID=A0A521AVU8_9BACT|nr:hypothetical protein [Fodinibius sediminis]SMO38949.1 hypothetical protein SAMN06265218_101424 [Fodinibius sediminis]
MAKINLEGNIPNTNKEHITYSVEGAEDMTIEELVESIRSKIQPIHKKSSTRKNTK